MSDTVQRRDVVETFGLAAEFDDPEALLAACHAAYAHGYRNLNAYSPYPVHGLAEAVGFKKTWVPLVVLIGGLVGMATGFGLQYWVSVYAYPLDIGGRPLNSWPSFVPITFEFTILFAAGSAVLGMLALNGLPMPWHPLFNVPAFDRASQDRFFLSIRSDDPLFDPDKTLEFLNGLAPLAVHDVPPHPPRKD